MSKIFNKNIPYTFTGGINLSTSAGLNITNNSNTIGSIITTGGNVGIGTTAPAYTLDINGTFEASNSNGLLLFASSGNVGIGTTSPNNLVTIRGVTQIGGIPNQGLSGGYRLLRLTPVSGSSTQITFDTSTSIGSTQSYIYNDSSNMEFSASRFYFGQNAGFGANVGIGTTSPTSSLDVLSLSTGQYPIISRFLAPNTTGGSSQSPRIVVGVDGIDSISMSYYKVGTTSANNYIGWGHTNVADGQMVLTRTGNVGIGTGSPSSRFHVNLPAGVGNGNVYFGATAMGYPPFGADCSVDNGVVGFLFNGASTSPKGLNIYYNGVSNGGGSSYFICNDYNSLRFQVLGNGNVQNANNSYGATSDIKVKENIVDATSKLDDLMKVKIRHFNRIGESTKQIGVIAQELETVFPGLVEETKDVDKDNNDLGTTTKAVKYSVFVPILIKSIQEQQVIINSQQSRIDKLMSFINSKFPEEFSL